MCPATLVTPSAATKFQQSDTNQELEIWGETHVGKTRGGGGAREGGFMGAAISGIDGNDGNSGGNASVHCHSIHGKGSRAKCGGFSPRLGEEIRYRGDAVEWQLRLCSDDIVIQENIMFSSVIDLLKLGTWSRPGIWRIFIYIISNFSRPQKYWQEKYFTRCISDRKRTTKSGSYLK